jgi:hypothetical protein
VAPILSDILILILFRWLKWLAEQLVTWDESLWAAELPDILKCFLSAATLKFYWKQHLLPQLRPSMNNRLWHEQVRIVQFSHQTNRVYVIGEGCFCKSLNNPQTGNASCCNSWKLVVINYWVLTILWWGHILFCDRPVLSAAEVIPVHRVYFRGGQGVKHYFDCIFNAQFFQNFGVGGMVGG